MPKNNEVLVQTLAEAARVMVLQLQSGGYRAVAVHIAVVEQDATGSVWMTNSSVEMPGVNVNWKRLYKKLMGRQS